MKITSSTKLALPVYSKFFKRTMFFAAAVMTGLSAFLFYTCVTNGSKQGSEDILLPAAFMAVFTFLCVWFAYASLRNKIIVNNGRINWGYFSRHAVSIGEITGITDMRSVTTLYGEQLVIVRFSDRKNKIHTMTVNSTQGKEFIDSMIETFGKPD